MKNKILVFGATGMLGRVVYHLLKTTNVYETYATVRNVNYANKGIFYLDANSFESDIEQIIQKLNSVQYFINCIGVLNKTCPTESLLNTNSVFPKKLSQFADKNNCYVINISSDAVFSDQTIDAVESSPTSPGDIYGITKYLGELITPRVLNIRTSIIGFDPIHHHGLLEKVIQLKDITGYINQKWTGATAFQLAMFVEWLLHDGNFLELRKKSPVFHFVPLGPITKYELINSFAKIYPQKIKVHKGKGNNIKRTLKTIYLESLFNTYCRDIGSGLIELLNYEKIYSKNSIYIKEIA